MNQDQVDQVTKAIARLKKGEAVSTKGILSVVYVQETLVLKCFKSELVRDEAFEYQTIACANGFGPVAYQIIDPIVDNKGKTWFCYVSEKVKVLVTNTENWFTFDLGYDRQQCYDIAMHFEDIARDIFKTEESPDFIPLCAKDIHYGNIGIKDGWPILIDFSR